MGLNMFPSKYLTKEDWFNTDDNHAIYFYSLAAEWTKYLIDSYGLEKYVTFYKNISRESSDMDVLHAYIDSFGLAVDEIERGFMDKITLRVGA